MEPGGKRGPLAWSAATLFMVVICTFMLCVTAIIISFILS
jgi:hypothetical protein